MTEKHRVYITLIHIEYKLINKLNIVVSRLISSCCCLLWLELPLDAILDAINASSTPSTSTDEDNDEVHNTLINQTITISDIIEALTIIKNNNVSISCPENPNSNGQNTGPASPNGSK